MTRKPPEAERSEPQRPAKGRQGAARRSRAELRRVCRAESSGRATGRRIGYIGPPMNTPTATAAPGGAQRIRRGPDGRLQVPDHPIVPFIEGDGTGPDIWAAAVRVFDAGVAKAYGGRRRIAWTEGLARE